MATVWIEPPRMSHRAKSRLSAIRTRILTMMVAWLLLGVLVGVRSGLALGGEAVTIVSHVIAGMILFPLFGLPLGAIGGRARESLLGAALGTVCGIALDNVAGRVAPLDSVTYLTVVGALVGATLRPYLTFTAWGLVNLYRAAASFLRSGSKVG